MFSSLASGAKALGLRFTISGLLPFAFLVGYIAALIAIAQAEPAESLFSVLKHSVTSLGPVGGVLLIVGSFLIAVVTQPFQVAFVRLLEGYWGVRSFSMAVRDVGVELQRRRKYRLELARTRFEREKRLAQADYVAQRLSRYPLSRDEMMPTLLGNALRASERSAGERYGLDTVGTWARLY